MSVDWWIYIPDLTNDHKLCDRKKKLDHGHKQQSFLQSTAGLSLRDRVRSSVMLEAPNKAASTFSKEPFEVIGHLTRMVPGRLLGDIFFACPTGRDPGVDLGYTGEITSPCWPGNALVFPWISWRRCLGRSKSENLCFGECPSNLTPYKQKNMDQWMDGHLVLCLFNIFNRNHTTFSIV